MQTSTVLSHALTEIRLPASSSGRRTGDFLKDLEGGGPHHRLSPVVAAGQHNQRPQRLAVSGERCAVPLGMRRLQKKAAFRWP